MLFRSEHGKGDAPGTAKLLLNNGAQVDLRTSNGLTALQLASQNGHIGVVNALLDKGAAIDAKEPGYGMTPLLYASWQGQTAIVEALLAKGANPNLSNSQGMTPLMAASQHCHVGAVQALLSHKADPNIQAANRTAQTLASHFCPDGQILRLLRGAGAKR